MYFCPSPAGGIQIVNPMEMFLKQIDRTSFQHSLRDTLRLRFVGKPGSIGSPNRIIPTKQRDSRKHRIGNLGQSPGEFVYSLLQLSFQHQLEHHIHFPFECDTGPGIVSSVFQQLYPYGKRKRQTALSFHFHQFRLLPLRNPYPHIAQLLQSAGKTIGRETYILYLIHKLLYPLIPHIHSLRQLKHASQSRKIREETVDRPDIGIYFNNLADYPRNRHITYPKFRDSSAKSLKFPIHFHVYTPLLPPYRPKNCNFPTSPIRNSPLRNSPQPPQTRK